MSATCVVVGATGTLGTAVARRLAKEHYTLHLVARSEAKLKLLAQSLDCPVSIAECDLGSSPHPESALDGLAEIDVLVNSAAVQGPIGPCYENDFSEWELALRINLLAQMRLCQASITRMGKYRRGKIINISGGGAMGPRANFSAYACSKAALVRFTETLAEEVAALNIDANCVSPGVMVSALTAEVLQNAFVGGKEHEAVSRAKPGDEARAAELIAYLASPESDGITGRSISAVWDDWQNLRAIAVGDRLTLRRIS